MKAVYTFPITGLVKVQPEEIFPVKAYGAEYTFVYDKDCLVTHVRVSINVQRESGTQGSIRDKMALLLLMLVTL